MKNRLLIVLSFLLCITSISKAETLDSNLFTKTVVSTQNDYEKIVWYNLVTPNIDVSKEFYASIFDWTFEDKKIKGQRFTVIKQNGKPIGGMLEFPKAEVSLWIASVSVPNINEAIVKHTANGGKLLIEPFNAMNTGEQVIVEGPLGEKMAFINNPASPVSLVDNGPSEWIWTELWSNDPKKSKLFYEAVWGVDCKNTVEKEKPYWYFENNDKKVAGMIANPAKGSATQWVPYVNIKDLQKLTETLKAQNVNIMLNASETENGSIVIFQDPNGATVGVQNYSK